MQNKSNSSGSYSCLICSDPPEGQRLDHGDTILNNKTTLTKAVQKIFQYLLIPDKYFNEVSDETKWMRFCTNCLGVVREIAKIHHKIEVLELQVQQKVESLGKLICDTSAQSLGGKIKGKPKRGAEIVEKFKKSVIKNFIEGLLPNPSVRLTPISSPGVTASGKKKHLILPPSSSQYKSKRLNSNIYNITVSPTENRVTSSSRHNKSRGASKVHGCKNKLRLRGLKRKHQDFNNNSSQNVDDLDYDSDEDLFVEIPKKPKRGRPKKIINNETSDDDDDDDEDSSSDLSDLFIEIKKKPAEISQTRSNKQSASNEAIEFNFHSNSGRQTEIAFQFKTTNQKSAISDCVKLLNDDDSHLESDSEFDYEVQSKKFVDKLKIPSEDSSRRSSPVPWSSNSNPKTFEIPKTSLGELSGLQEDKRKVEENEKLVQVNKENEEIHINIESSLKCSVCEKPMSDAIEESLSHKWSHMNLTERNDALDSGKDVPQLYRQSLIAGGRDHRSFKFNHSLISDIILRQTNVKYSQFFLKDGPTIVKCRHCPHQKNIEGSNTENFVTKSMIEHFLDEHFEPSFSCTICGCGFSKEMYLMQHYEKSHFST